MRYGPHEVPDPRWSEEGARRHAITESIPGVRSLGFWSPLSSETTNALAMVAEVHVCEALGLLPVGVLDGPDGGADTQEPLMINGREFSIDVKWTPRTVTQRPHLAARAKTNEVFEWADLYILVCGGVEGDVSGMRVAGWAWSRVLDHKSWDWMKHWPRPTYAVPFGRLRPFAELLERTVFR